MNDVVNKRYLFNQFEPEVKRVVRGILELTLNEKSIVLSRHAIQRATRKKVDINDFIYSLKNKLYHIVEVNIKDNEVRCLVRTKEKNGYESVVSVVLFSGRICTCWKNEVTDIHNSLDISLYSEEVDISELMSLFNLNFESVSKGKKLVNI